MNLAQIEAPFSGRSALTSLIPSPDKAPLVPGALYLRPSRLRPNCQAAERLFLWKGVNSPPPSTICHPAIVSLEALAAKASLRDTSGYGAGLRKFHLFCDAFSIPEHQRLPASFELLHSFALWAAADPDLVEVAQLSEQISFEPVAPSVVRKYLAAVRAWHIVQGWPAPLEANHLLNGFTGPYEGSRIWGCTDAVHLAPQSLSRCSKPSNPHSHRPILLTHAFEL